MKQLCESICLCKKNTYKFFLEVVHKAQAQPNDKPDLYQSLRSEYTVQSANKDAKELVTYPSESFEGPSHDPVRCHALRVSHLAG